MGPHTPQSCLTGIYQYRCRFVNHGARYLYTSFRPCFGRLSSDHLRYFKSHSQDANKETRLSNKGFLYLQRLLSYLCPDKGLSRFEYASKSPMHCLAIWRQASRSGYLALLEVRKSVNWLNWITGWSLAPFVRSLPDSRRRQSGQRSLSCSCNKNKPITGPWSMARRKMAWDLSPSHKQPMIPLRIFLDPQSSPNTSLILLRCSFKPVWDCYQWVLNKEGNIWGRSLDFTDWSNSLQAVGDEVCFILCQVYQVPRHEVKIGVLEDLRTLERLPREIVLVLMLNR